MQIFGIVLNKVIMLFICMSIGFVCKRIKMLSVEAKNGLSALLINVTLPCSIIYSMQRPFSIHLIQNGFVLIIVSVIIFVGGAAIGLLICKIARPPETDKGVCVTSLLLPNMIFMGAPVVSAIYGNDGLFYIYIAHIPFIVIAFTLGMKSITIGYDRMVNLNPKDIFLSPAILCTFIGILLFVNSITLPAVINDALNSVGVLTTPLSMIIIGVSLADNDFKQFFISRLNYVILVVKLICMPLAFYYLLRFFIHDSLVLGVLVFIAAMPAATMTSIFATRHKTNEALASQIVCVSTFCSIFTLPAVSLLLNS